MEEAPYTSDNLAESGIVACVLLLVLSRLEGRHAKRGRQRSSSDDFTRVRLVEKMQTKKNAHARRGSEQPNNLLGYR